MKNTEVEEIILDMLPQISFFGGADKEEMVQIMEYVEEEIFSAGDYVYKEGDPPGDLYIILDGDMEFFILGEKVADGKKGLLFGMSATIGIQKQLVSALAITDLKVAVISKKLFMTMCERNPRLFGKIVLNVARDLARDLNFLKDYVEETRRKCKLV